MSSSDIAQGIVGQLQRMARDRDFHGRHVALEIALGAPLAFDLPPLPASDEGVGVEGVEAYVAEHGDERCAVLLDCLTNGMFGYTKITRKNATAHGVARYYVQDKVEEGEMDPTEDHALYARELEERERERQAVLSKGGEARRRAEAERAEANRRSKDRPTTYDGGTTREDAKAALRQAVCDHEGRTANLLVGMVTSALAANVLYALLGELVEDGQVETYEWRGKSATLRLHRPTNALSGLSARQLAAHRENVTRHALHWTTIARRMASGMSNKEAISKPTNPGGKGTRKKKPEG